MNYIKANSPPMSLVLTTHSTIQNVEYILEQFFDYHIAYQWDKAKEYIEHERDQFRAKNSHSILISMLHYLAQIIVADRNYLTLQFFSSKVFQRKDLLKSTYENLRNEFQRLEERSNQLFLKHNFHSLPFQSSPIHNSQQQTTTTASSSVGSICELYDESSEPARDALDCLHVFIDEAKEPATESDNNRSDHQSKNKSQPSSEIKIATSDDTDTQQLSSSLTKDVSDPNIHGSSTKSSFFSKFFRKFSSSSNSQIINSKSQDTSSFSIMENLPDDQLITSESNISLDSLDQFAGHICGQLLNYCKVRIEMIDFYERLANIDNMTIGKFCILDDCLKTLINIHNFADDSFHHPVLTRIKIMFMFECDVLLSLLRAQQSIQQWKYLESLFSLQDAHNKINRLSNPREFLFDSMMLTPGSMIKTPDSQQLYSSISPTIAGNSSSSPTSKQSSSNISKTLAISTGSNNKNNPHSPLSPNLNFVYPTAKDVGNNTMLNSISTSTQSQSTAKNLFQRVHQSTTPSSATSSSSSSSSMINDPKSIPLLIQWFNKFKLFLLSKYSFYFHSLLLVHLTPVQSISLSSSNTISMMNSSNSLSSLISQNQLSLSSSMTTTAVASSSASNYAQTETFMRNLCGKHFLVDFHTKIVQFLKKLDSSYMVLIFNTNGKTISMSGYRSPYIEKDSLQGRSSLPIIYSYPGEFNMNRHPSLIMIMDNHRRTLNSSDQVVVEHDKSTPIAPQAININNNNRSNIETSSNSSPPVSITPNTATAPLQQVPNATYYLVRPDPNYTLALVCESTRRNASDSHIISFMQEIGSSLKDTKILTSLRTGTFKKS